MKTKGRGVDGKVAQAKLRCEGLNKSFDGTVALQDVYFEFPLSGIVAIIGPNGAGKTTFLNVLTGFEPVHGGRFFLGERELSRMAPHKIARQGIARTFQDLRLIRQVPLLDNMMMARPNQKGEGLFRALFPFGVSAQEAWNRKEALRWLRFVGLEEKAYEPAGELSYGQQKLLALACCLATEAGILFLDEPFAGVHPQMVSQILCLLRKLKGMGKLVVFIEHDIAAVRQVADTVIVMDEGRIISQGDPIRVLNQPAIMEAYLT